MRPLWPVHVRYWPNVRSRWLDIGNVPSLHFYGTRWIKIMTAVKSSQDRTACRGEINKLRRCAPTYAGNLRQKLKTEAKHLKITQAKCNTWDKIKSNFTSFVKESRKLPVRSKIPYQFARVFQRIEIESSQGLLG